MTWFVLIIMLNTGGGITATFYGKERCMVAFNDIMAQIKESNYTTAHVGCYPTQS